MMPPALARLYRALRVADIVALIVALLGVLCWLPDSPGMAALLVVTWLVAVVEFINYFVVRLSYPIGG